MNWVMTLTHNNLDLTKRCLESIKTQDVPWTLFVFDNGSTDGTGDWLMDQGMNGMTHPQNIGVSCGWNIGINFSFENGATHVLVVGNDTVLPPWFLRELLSYDV